MTGTLCVFWATVCKTVRPTLSDHCPVLSVCLSVCLSAIFVYCGQTVGWIKMKLGMEVGLCLGHFVLDRDLAPLPKRGTYPSFRPMSIVAKRSPVSASAEPLLVLCGRLCCYASTFGRTEIYPEYIPASLLLLNVGCFTLAQKLQVQIL